MRNIFFRIFKIICNFGNCFSFFKFFLNERADFLEKFFSFLFSSLFSSLHSSLFSSQFSSFFSCPVSYTHLKDSGISTKDTTRVSNKFNGVQSSTGIANAAKSSAKLGGAFGGGMAAVESIVNGDDLSTTTGNVASGALKGSVSGLSLIHI